MLDDLQLALQSCSTITTTHMNLISFSVMNVCLVAIVLSISVSVALKEYGQPVTANMAKYCEMLDKFFNFTNVCNAQEFITKNKPFLKPYTSFNDERVNRS